MRIGLEYRDQKCISLDLYSLRFFSMLRNLSLSLRLCYALGLEGTVLVYASAFNLKSQKPSTPSFSFFLEFTF